MTNLNTVTQSALVNATHFENEVNKLALAIKGNEFSLYTLVSHELNTSDETIVKETFTRIMITDNGFNPSTVARYFTDVKKLSVIASNHVTLAGYKKALKELGITNMNTANTWLSRESAITIAIRSVNLANRNDLLSKRNDIKNVSDVRLLLTAISEQATIDEKSNKEAAAAKVASEAAAPTVTAPIVTAPTVTAPTKKTKVCTDEMFDAVLATMRIMSDLQLKNLQASLLAMVEQKKTGTK